MPSNPTINTTPRILTCPGCGERVKWSMKNPHRPFCSDRCKLIDLGAWADESHKIEGNNADDDLFSDQLEPN